MGFSAQSPDPLAQDGRNHLVNAAAVVHLFIIAAEAALMVQRPTPFHQLFSRGRIASLAETSLRSIRSRSRLMISATLPLLSCCDRSHSRSELTIPLTPQGSRSRLVELATPSQHLLHSTRLVAEATTEIASPAPRLWPLRTLGSGGFPDSPSTYCQHELSTNSSPIPSHPFEVLSPSALQPESYLAVRPSALMTSNT